MSAVDHRDVSDDIRSVPERAEDVTRGALLASIDDRRSRFALLGVGGLLALLAAGATVGGVYLLTASSSRPSPSDTAIASA